MFFLFDMQEFELFNLTNLRMHPSLCCSSFGIDVVIYSQPCLIPNLLSLPTRLDSPRKPNSHQACMMHRDRLFSKRKNLKIL